MAAVELLETRQAGTPSPFSAQMAGDWRAAAAAWEETGCPYEQALALMDASDILAKPEGTTNVHGRRRYDDRVRASDSRHYTVNH